jgi:hypothetical protein
MQERNRVVAAAARMIMSANNTIEREEASDMAQRALEQ